MRFTLLAVDLLISFYITSGVIAGYFEWIKYHHPCSRWSSGKISKREMTICMIVALPFTPVVAAFLGILFHI